MRPYMSGKLKLVLLALAALFGIFFFLAKESTVAGKRRHFQAAGEPAGIDKAGLETVQTSIDYSKKYDVCTIGAGLSGTIFAERYASVLGKKALVIDSRPHFGGNCYDYRDTDTDILMNKYGAHLFHTNSEKAWRCPQPDCARPTDV